MRSLTHEIRKVFRKYGYIVQKYPSNAFSTLPVFDLCVSFVMSRSGDALTFIQVGANDGKFVDPIRKYILAHPWQGVLVEPQTDVFEALQENYAEVSDRLIFENCAIGSHGQELSMYRRPKSSTQPGDGIYASSVVSSKRQVAANQLGLAESELEEFKVPCKTLDELIAQHDIHDLHLLQVDTEGQDAEVLGTIDLSKTRPTIIQFEHGHLRPSEITQLVNRLNHNGYDVLYGGYQTDTIAVERSIFSF